MKAYPSDPRPSFSLDSVHYKEYLSGGGKFLIFAARLKGKGY